MYAQPRDDSAIPPALPMFLRMPTVIRMTGLGRSTIYRMIAEEKFPKSVRIGERAVAWRQIDLDRWCQSREVSH
jgi:prophage regulatory protein